MAPSCTICLNYSCHAREKSLVIKISTMYSTIQLTSVVCPRLVWKLILKAKSWKLDSFPILGTNSAKISEANITFINKTYICLRNLFRILCLEMRKILASSFQHEFTLQHLGNLVSSSLLVTNPFKEISNLHESIEYEVSSSGEF